MTKTANNVPRELLERVASQPARGKADYELRAILSAPSPAGVDGLEVVGYLTLHALETDMQQPVDEPLCRLSDAQAIIDGLRGEVGAQRVKTCAALKERNDAREERDQQAQRIGELEELLRESYSFLPSAFTELLSRIDAALSELPK